MSTSYAKEALSQEKKDIQRQLQERNAQVWETILDETDQTPGQAFFDRVVAWCGGVLTTDKYDMLAATCALPEFAEKSWHRGDLKYYIQKVVDRLRSRNWSDDNIRAKAAELWNKTKPEVRAYLQKLGFLEEVHTLEQAKDFLQRHRLLKQQQSYFAPNGSGPYPRLPRHIVPVGFVTAVELNARYIKSLDAADVAKLVRRYHISQINERLAQGEIQ